MAEINSFPQHSMGVMSKKHRGMLLIQSIPPAPGALSMLVLQKYPGGNLNILSNCVFKLVQSWFKIHYLLICRSKKGQVQSAGFFTKNRLLYDSCEPVQYPSTFFGSLFNSISHVFNKINPWSVDG